MSLPDARRQKRGGRRLIGIVPLEQFLEESGEPHIILDRAGLIVFETAAAKPLLDVAIKHDRFDTDNALAELVAEWCALQRCFEYTWSARLTTSGDTAGAVHLTGSTIEYRGARHLLCRLRAEERASPTAANLWSEVADAARDSAFAAMGAMVEHELNQSLAAIVNYVQTSAALLDGRAESACLVRNALSEAGQQALHGAELVRVLRRRFGYPSGTLERHSLPDALRQAHTLLTQITSGSTAKLELRGADPRLFAKLSYAHFLSMSVLLMRRSLRSVGAPRTTITVSIAAGDDEHVVLRFLNCVPWLEGAGKVSAESGPSDNEDFRLFAICRATMDLHGGHVSIEKTSGKGSEIILSLKKAKIEERQRA